MPVRQERAAHKAEPKIIHFRSLLKQRVNNRELACWTLQRQRQRKNVDSELISNLMANCCWTFYFKRAATQTVTTSFSHRLCFRSNSNIIASQTVSWSKWTIVRGAGVSGTLIWAISSQSSWIWVTLLKVGESRVIFFFYRHQQSHTNEPNEGNFTSLQNSCLQSA